MKQPKLDDMKIDSKGTRAMRAKLAKTQKVKITINVDKESLVLLRKMSDSSGIPYQRLLNRVLKEGLSHRRSSESRIERVEREIELLKGKLAA